MFLGGISGWISQWTGYTQVSRFFVAPGIGGAQVCGEDRNRLAILFMSATGGTFNLDFDRNATAATGLIFDPNSGFLLLTAEWFPEIVGSRWHAVGSAGSQLTGLTVSQIRDLPANSLFTAPERRHWWNREPAKKNGNGSLGVTLPLSGTPRPASCTIDPTLYRPLPGWRWRCENGKWSLVK